MKQRDMKEDFARFGWWLTLCWRVWHLRRWPRWMMDLLCFMGIHHPVWDIHYTKTIDTYWDCVVCGWCFPTQLLPHKRISGLEYRAARSWDI